VSEKKSFVIRIDIAMYKALEKWAADDFRSVNGQIEWILTQRLKDEGRLRDPGSNAGNPKGTNKSDNKK
jgi:hypothetical protein